MDKKISLEHAIKNIVRESIGAVGTDKFKGTQPAFLKPIPPIEPPKGSEHPDGASAVAKRGAAKIKQSETMKEEEQLDEASLKSVANTGYNIGRNIGDIITYGGLDYLGATRDYLAKNIGSLAGLTKPTTFAKELGHEKEKTKKAEEDLPAAIKTGVKTVKAGQEGFAAGAGKQEVKAGLDYLGKKVTGEDKEKWGGIDKELGKLGTEYAHELEKGQKAYEYAPKTYTGMEVGGTASALVGLPLAAARGTLGAVRMGAKYGPKMVGATGKNVLPKTAKTLSDVNVVAPTAAGVSATAGHAATADVEGESKIKTQTEKALRKTLEPVVAVTKPLLIKGYEKISEYEKKKKLKEGAAEDLFKVFKGAVKSADEIANEFKAGKITKQNLDAEIKFMSPGRDRAKLEKLRKDFESQKTAKPAPKPEAPKREDRPEKPYVDKPANVPPGVTPLPVKTPPPYKPLTDPFVPMPPANVPPKVPQRTFPDTVPEPANPQKPAAPVKAPEPKFPGPNERPAPTVNPVETKPKVTPTEVPALPVDPRINPKFLPGNRPAPAPAPAPVTRPVPVTQPAPAPAHVTQPVPVAKPLPTERKRPDDDAVVVPKPETAKDKGKKPDESGTGKREPEGGKPPRKRRLPFGLGLPSISPGVLAGLRGFVPVTPYVHHADPYIREDNEAVTVRKSIENVARPGGKTRIAKQGEIKTKIIDENAKRADIIRQTIADKKSTVVLKPKLKHPELDEN